VTRAWQKCVICGAYQGSPYPRHAARRGRIVGLPCYPRTSTSELTVTGKEGKKGCSIKPHNMTDHELPVLVFPRAIPGRLSSTQGGIILWRAGPFPSRVSMKEHRQRQRSRGGVQRERWEGRTEEVQVEVLADIPDYSHQECQSVRSHRR
jgi:hypothetical protein